MSQRKIKADGLIDVVNNGTSDSWTGDVYTTNNSMSGVLGPLGPYLHHPIAKWAALAIKNMAGMGVDPNRIVEIIQVMLLTPGRVDDGEMMTLYHYDITGAIEARIGAQMSDFSAKLQAEINRYIYTDSART